MTIAIVKSPQFDRDLEAIWLHIAERDTVAADRVITAIDKTIALLADFPAMGLACPHLAENLRRVLWREYAIFYRWDGTRVELARVLHGRRKIGASSF